MNDISVGEIWIVDDKECIVKAITDGGNVIFRSMGHGHEGESLTFIRRDSLSDVGAYRKTDGGN